MFSFFKKNKPIEIPEWASFFDAKEYAAFLSAIDRYFKDLDINYQIVDDGIIEVTENDFGLNQLGLLNVAQVCKQNGLNSFNQMVEDHFNSLKRTHEFNQDFDKIVHDFEKIKNYLGVRLYPQSFVESAGSANVIWKQFAGDICTMLIFDLPDSVSSIKPDKAEKWEKDFDELFTLGIKNIKENYPVSITQQKINEFNVWLVQGDHFFTANIAFELANMKELTGSKGSLISMPHRHAVIIYPIETLEVTTVINQLIPITYQMNQEGPGSLSNHLFWFSNNEFTNLPYKVEENKLQFYPPESFIAMLNSLA